MVLRWAGSSLKLAGIGLNAIGFAVAFRAKNCVFPALPQTGAGLICRERGAGHSHKDRLACGARVLGAGGQIQAVPLPVLTTYAMDDVRGAIITVYGIGGEEKVGGAGDVDVKPGGEPCAAGFHVGVDRVAWLWQEDKTPGRRGRNRDGQGMTESNPGWSGDG